MRPNFLLTARRPSTSQKSYSQATRSFTDFSNAILPSTIVPTPFWPPLNLLARKYHIYKVLERSRTPLIKIRPFTFDLYSRDTRTFTALNNAIPTNLLSSAYFRSPVTLLPEKSYSRGTRSFTDADPAYFPLTGHLSSFWLLVILLRLKNHIHEVLERSRSPVMPTRRIHFQQAL